jgi:hypothetical protein
MDNLNEAVALPSFGAPGSQQRMGWRILGVKGIWEYVKRFKGADVETFQPTAAKQLAVTRRTGGKPQIALFKLNVGLTNLLTKAIEGQP